MNRLGIFVFYDKEGIVGDYIKYFLDKMIPFLNRLIIVINGEICIEGKQILSCYSTEILERENKGFDGEAYRYALISYLTKGEVENYDEIILFNDTFYGPFFEISKVFERMEKSDSDIWGLSMHGKIIIFDEPKNEHIQSYFIAITNKVLKNDAFWNFWKNMGVAIDFDSAVDNFEIKFSEAMMSEGFIIKTYLHEEKYETDNLYENYNYSQLSSYEMIKKNQFPIFKRKNIISSQPIMGECYNTLCYIQRETDYPIEYIWRDILHKYSLDQISNGMGFDLNLSNVEVSQQINYEEIILFLEILSQDYYDDFEYLIYELGNAIDVVLFIGDDITDRRGDAIKKSKVKKISIGTEFDIYRYLRDNPQLYDKYEYIGVCVDDLKCSGFHRLWRKIQRNTEIRECFNELRTVSKIVNSFNKDCSLGAIYPEEMPFYYYQKHLNGWYIGNMVDYSDQKGLNLRISRDGSIITGAYSFWTRREILKECLSTYGFSRDNWVLTLPYLLQSMGYHIFYVVNKAVDMPIISEYKRVIQIAVDEIKKSSNNMIGEVNDNNIVKQLELEIRSLRNEINKIKIENALEKLLVPYSGREIFLYGCGKVSNEYTNILLKNGHEICGYIVSDGEEHPKSFFCRPVIELSEYEKNQNRVLILAIGRKSLAQIKNVLIEKNILDYITVEIDNP